MAQHSHTNPSQCTSQVQRVLLCLKPHDDTSLLQLTCQGPDGETLSVSNLRCFHIRQVAIKEFEIIGEIVGKFSKNPFILSVFTKIPARRENKSKFLVQNAVQKPSIYGGLFIAHTLRTARYIETSGFGLRKTREILGDTPHGTPVVVHDYVCIHIRERRTS
jgi:hypothetical protein